MDSTPFATPSIPFPEVKSPTSSLPSSPSVTSPSPLQAGVPKKSSSAAGTGTASNGTTNRPFSSSAAKRSSVMALGPGSGSIKYLQHVHAKMGMGLTGSVASGLVGTSVLVEEPAGLEEDGFGIDNEANSRKQTKKGNRKLKLGQSGINVLQDTILELPPTPVKPSNERLLPWELGDNKQKSLKSEKGLRKEVLRGLDSVCEIWGLVEGRAGSMKRARRSASFSNENGRRSENYSESSTTDGLSVVSSEGADSLDVPRPLSSLFMLSDDFEPLSNPNFIKNLLETTKAAVRSVQSYLVSFPQNCGELSTSNKFSPAPSSASKFLGDPFRSESTLPTLSRKPSYPSTSVLAAPSSLMQLKRLSLEVLSLLRDIEAKYRTLPSTTSSDVSSLLQDFANGKSFDSMDDESVHDSVTPGSHSMEPIEEEVSAGFTYRSDISPEDLAQEADIVRSYVELVDSALLRSRRSKSLRKSSGRKDGNEEKENRDSESGGGEGLTRSDGVPQNHGELKGSEPDFIEVSLEDLSEVDDIDELPEWVTEEYENDLDRAYVIIASHLPPDFKKRLVDPSRSSSSEFFDSLADGQLLCHSYNAVLRSSTRPFGFIPAASIHEALVDTSSLSSSTSSDKAISDGRQKVGATFRRIENLRIWGAALKFRYLINLNAVPGEKDVDTVVGFDPKVIGRKGAGWMEMLASALNKWVSVVVQEKRDEGMQD